MYISESSSYRHPINKLPISTCFLLFHSLMVVFRFKISSTVVSTSLPITLMIPTWKVSTMLKFRSNLWLIIVIFSLLLTMWTAARYSCSVVCKKLLDSSLSKAKLLKTVSIILNFVTSWRSFPKIYFCFITPS